MTVFLDIFALLLAATGWHYLFFSRAAHKLKGLESDRTNRGRIRMRRIVGALLTLLGALVFAGAQEIGLLWFFVIWGAVILLLPVICILVMIDVRLMLNLKERRGQGPP